jgi:hypothetical protein
LIGSFGWKSILLLGIPIGVLTLAVAGLVLAEDIPRLEAIGSKAFESQA